MLIRITLVVDGSSDQALKPVIEWLFQQHLPIGQEYEVMVARLPFSCAPNERLRLSWEYYPGDVLFVHRDAEKELLAVRREQIDTWVSTSFDAPPPYIKVVPVRMTEAWLLLNEPAIREAAGNPNGSVKLPIPALSKLDVLPDPKEVLLELLLKATENTPRRRRSFNARQAIHRLAEFQKEIGFHALRALPAFAALEEEVRTFIHAHSSSPGLTQTSTP